MMKTGSYRLLLFLVSVSAALLSRAEVVTYNTMPDQGIWLRSGWLFNADDRPFFSQADIDDSRWASITPDNVLADLPELEKVKIGWLRLHLQVGDSLSGKALLLLIRQNCASEIYLDGKFLERCGTLSTDPAEVVARHLIHPPLEIKLSPGTAHVIAIRFSPLPAASVFRNTTFLLQANLKGVPQYSILADTLKNRFLVYGSLIVFFALLSLLHLSFYRYHPGQRANLFFAVYTAFMSIGFFLATWETDIEHSATYLFVDTFAWAFTLIGGIWVVKALLSLFDFRHPKTVTLLWSMYVICTVTTCFLLSGMAGYAFYLAGIAAPVLVQLWLTCKALKKKKRGAKIIAAGFAVSLAALLVTVIAIIFRLSLGDLWNHIRLFIIFSAPGVGISLYLAREFALDSRLLQQKLRQVEELSALNLQQEHEKQQLLARQNDELEKQVTARTSELQSSLATLKAAQQQLIQSEKMASLGELTAGIAHEIQNPLNFVNNFSDVSAELAEEMVLALHSNDQEEAAALASDIKENLQKIGHHGRRADAIVKSMLQHSGTGTGKKEPADINALADECLRISYHGVRARYKWFSAGMTTRFDNSIGAVEMVPQDMGKVLLNLFNNAFYAVMQKKTQFPDDYEPLVTVSTRKLDGKVEISVTDNGTGIPQKVLDKIYQPFFTTKPTGEGTGLGLSLSYDIITRGHGGEIKVQTEEGKGSQFIIQLPA